jgi:hypothetical protein
LRWLILRQNLLEARLADESPSPLHVLLTTMHQRWAEGKLDEAAALAKAAAPYLHPRAAAGRGLPDLGSLTDEQLDELCAGYRELGFRGEGSEEENPQEP